MTGAVTYEQLWGFVGVFATAGGIVAGLLAWLWRFVSAIRRAYLNDIEALKADIKAGNDALAEYKQHVAENFASRIGVTQQINRLEAAVEGIAEKVEASSNRITERIDRLLENQAHQANSPRRRTGA